MSHVAYMTESCRTNEFVRCIRTTSANTMIAIGNSLYTRVRALDVNMSFKWMSHVTHMNESCHTYEWVVSRIWMRHVTHMNESCHAFEWGMSRIWMSHVTHLNKACHAYEWVMSRIKTTGANTAMAVEDFVTLDMRSCTVYDNDYVNMWPERALCTSQ